MALYPVQINKGTLGAGAAFYGNFVEDGTANTAPTVNTLFASPFRLVEGGTPDLIQADVQATGAGSSFRIAIYQNVAFDYLYPGALVSGTDVGTLSGTSTGMKQNTVTGVKLDSGLYWAVYNSTGTAPTLVCVGLSAADALLGISATTVTGVQTGISVALTFAAMPATFPTGAAYTTTATIPRISMRFSA